MDKNDVYQISKIVLMIVGLILFTKYVLAL